MDIRIMGVQEAALYIPEKPTYAIRIMFSEAKYNKELVVPLCRSKLYRMVNEYTFDDLYPGEREGVLFDQDIAKKIIEDFNKGREDCTSLLVHCWRGKNRSPAIGIALNEIFDLGNSTSALKFKFIELNYHVYDTMISTGKKLGLVGRLGN